MNFLKEVLIRRTKCSKSDVRGFVCRFFDLNSLYVKDEFPFKKISVSKHFEQDPSPGKFQVIRSTLFGIDPSFIYILTYKYIYIYL